ncbi:MAG: bifunctional diguanylate cyclase/phosphodiesterase [Actinobacteria bacterium]|nr:MAG: bifunctional diguanylate cyclase/phosphodiesterase [Actinomycetota bacterium]
MKAMLRFGSLTLLIISVAIKAFLEDSLPLNDAWIYNVIILTTALSAFAIRTQAASALGSAILFWGIGSIIATYANYLNANSTAAESVARWSDLFYLLFYPALFSAITLRGQSRLHITDIIDSLIIGLGLSAIGSALIVQPIMNQLIPATSSFALATTIYPVADLTMLALFFAKAYQDGQRRNWNDGLMALGVLCFALSDGSFLYQQSNYSYNNWMDYGWLIGLVLMSESMHHSHQQFRTRERSTIPLVIAILASLALLVAAALFPHTFPRLAIWPAAATLLAALGRLTLAVRDARKLITEEVLARTDELTGLANRRRFVAALDDVRKGNDAQGDSVGVFILDLDGFKDVNDTWGHEAGDQLLKLLASRLLDALPRDALLARLGGDEFGVVISGDERVIRLIGPALQRASAAPMNITHESMVVEASVGLAISSRNNFTPSDSLRRADIAMYHAKAARTGFVEWNADLERRSLLKEKDDFQSLQKKLVLYFQPIYQLYPRTLKAGEALLRMRDENEKILLPSNFLTRFSGYEYPLMLHVLREVCQNLRSWANDSFCIHINIEGQVLINPRFIDDLRQIVLEAGVSLQQITLEITEKELLADEGAIQINRLRALGVRVAIDDFGSGYSALSYLQKFRVDWIKLDQTLIAPLTREAVDDRAIEVVRTTVELAGRLAIDVVAEGVESARALTVLGELGVTHAQGFYLGPPVDADEFGRLLSLPYA